MLFRVLILMVGISSLKGSWTRVSIEVRFFILDPVSLVAISFSITVALPVALILRLLIEG